MTCKDTSKVILSLFCSSQLLTAIYRDYYIVTFISSPISSRGKRHQPKAKSWNLFSRDDVGLDMKVIMSSSIYHLSILKFRNFQDLSIFLFVNRFILHIVFGLVRMLLGRLHYFLLIRIFLCTFHVTFMPYWSKLCCNLKDVYEVGHFDSVTLDNVYDISRHVGTKTDSDMVISPQIEIFAKEAMCCLSTVLAICSSASEPKKGMVPFSLLQRTLYPVLYWTAYEYRNRDVIS